MKWIGQHIWDFISRFRSDVYLEGTDSGTIASGGNLGLDSNNKIVKSASPSGSIDLTSEVTGTLPVANGGTSATSLTDNSVLTGTGTSAITAEANFTFNGSSLALTGVMDISPANDAGATALLIDNDDADQIALSIDAANTTADIISVTGNTLTSGSFIDYTGVATGVNLNGLIDIDITNADTTTTNFTGISIDYNKSGVTAASQFAVFTGINIDYDDTATNNAAGNSVVKGMLIYLNNDSDQGVISQTGLDVWCTGADAASTSGIIIRTPNGANDLRIISQDSAADIFTIDTKEDGETTLTTVENGGGSTAHMNLVADGDIVLDSASSVIKTGSTTFVNNSGVIQVAGQTNITSVGTLTGLTTSGAIELGHADDTTLARSAAGIATIEGKQIFTTNIPALTSGAAGVPAVTMQTRRTITTAEANDMHNTTIELVPVQGANNVIVPIGGMIRVDRAAAQLNTACDLNMHIGNHPGVYFSTSLAHQRRFMVGEASDRVFSITAMMAATEVGQSISGDANKPLQISFDAAATTDCFTSIDVFLTYQVISIA